MMFTDFISSAKWNLPPSGWLISGSSAEPLMSFLWWKKFYALYEFFWTRKKIYALDIFLDEFFGGWVNQFCRQILLPASWVCKFWFCTFWCIDVYLSFCIYGAWQSPLPTAFTAWQIENQKQIPKTMLWWEKTNFAAKSFCHNKWFCKFCTFWCIDVYLSFRIYICIWSMAISSLDSIHCLTNTESEANPKNNVMMRDNQKQQILT